MRHLHVKEQPPAVKDAKLRRSVRCMLHKSYDGMTPQPGAAQRLCMCSAPPSKPSVRAQYPFIQAVDIEVLDLGEEPPAIGGAKSYATSNDEAVIEAPVMWGGDARVRVALRVKLGGFVLYLPVEVRDLQVSHAPRLKCLHGPALALEDM